MSEEREANMASFGLSVDATEPYVEENEEEIVEEEEEDVEESEGEDDVEEESEDDEEEESEEEDEDEEDDAKTPVHKSLNKARKRAERAEKKLEEVQKKADQEAAAMRSQLRELWNEFQSFKSEASDNESTDDLTIDGLDDDDIVDVKSLKKVLASKKEPPKKQADNKEVLAWVQNQSDFPQVQQYINEHLSDLQNDPELNSIPANDTRSLYFAVKSRMKEKELDAKLEVAVKQALAKQRKRLEKSAKIPPTGGTRSKSLSKSKVQSYEDKLRSFFVGG